jgi:glycosidase
MSFVDDMLGAPRPERVRNIDLPRRTPYFPSPADWRSQVIYFLLPDRFSDGREGGRPLLDRNNVAASRPAVWDFGKWFQSGSQRYQGGTLKGVTSKLDYLRNLGVTAIWIGPVFKNRRERNDFHGYAIQDFLDVDPRFGNRADLVDLVKQAHSRNIRVLLDIVFNHTGDNWAYDGFAGDPPYRPWPGFYKKGDWRSATGGTVPTVGGPDDGVWPRELQNDPYYTRAGHGSLSQTDLEDPHAEFRRTDFDGGDRDVNFDGTGALSDLARCYKYWIALTDCDGFRIDTLKHMDFETGRNFCGAIREFAANLGKNDFFLVGEVAGGDYFADRYLEVVGNNLSATLDIDTSCTTLRNVARGLTAPRAYFEFLRNWDDRFGSHRRSGAYHVSVLDDHDHVTTEKLRFASNAPAGNAYQAAAAVAIQLFSLGIPCIYYGTEQSFSGPDERDKVKNLGFGNHDAFLRECMFGPEHPRSGGGGAFSSGAAGFDSTLPGFGAFGSAGAHCFDEKSPAYARISHLAKLRGQFPVLSIGRHYERPISNFSQPFANAPSGELICWSRILDEDEALCVVDGHGDQSRGADVVVDSNLNGAGSTFTVIANTAQAAANVAGNPYTGTHPVGEKLPVRQRNGASFVEIRNVGKSEVLVLLNRP